MRILALFVSFLFVFLCPAQSQHRDDARRFTIAIPKGWTESTELLNFMNDFAKQAAPDAGFEYIAAFIPEGERTESSPYVVIQYSTLPSGGVTYEALEAALKGQSSQAAVEKATENAKDSLGKYTVGVPTLDRSTNHVYLRIHGGGDTAQTHEAASQQFDSLCIGTLTNHGIIQINSYAIAGSGVDPVAQAETFLAGLKIDEGTRFVPLTVGQAQSPESVTKTVAGKLGKSLLRGIIIAVIVTAIALVYALWSVKREKNKQG